MCGIPSIGTNGNGANGNGIRTIGDRANRSPAHAYPISEVPKAVRRPRSAKCSLERLLDWVMEHENRCLDMLKQLPWETQEYAATMERFDRLQEAGAQVRAQLAARRLR